ncbi:MAG TPA: TIR domain-containing protein [Halothiobacillaceae bacterium]|nr:TIR domain-containing protein [Halothiobacillaceae bacterium]
MPSLFDHRLFISHSWRHGEKYQRILNFLDSARNFQYRNLSVPVDRRFPSMTQTELREELRQQIRPAQVVVILGGMYVSHSNWIQFEIDFARSLMKPILGIRPWGAQRMPAAVNNAANIVVGWNTDSIVNAIRQLR